MNSRPFYIGIAALLALSGSCGGDGPGAASCGDGTCDEDDEDCEECPGDCGECEMISCEDGACMVEACNGDYLWVHFAEEILAQPACDGATLPAWFSDQRCFIGKYEWELLAEPDNECRFLYAYCPCDDGTYQWVEFAGQMMGVVLTDSAAVAAIEPFECGEVDEYCLNKD